MFCERHYTAPVKGDGQFFSLGLSVPCHTKGLFPGHGRGRAFFLETIPETEQYYLTNMIFSPLLKKGVLLLAFCGVLGGGVLSAQEAGGAPITEEGLKALDSNVFANEYMLALKPNVTRDRIARIKDPFVRGLAEQMAEKKFDRKARALTAEPYEPVKDLAERLRTSQYSKFENPTRIFLEEVEDVLLVMGDPKGEKLNLVIHNFGRDGGHSSYPLKEGVNIIRAKNKGLGYIEYFTSNYKKAPKVHLSILSGKVNGVFVGGVSKNSDWKRMLENSPTEVVDIVGNRVHLVYPVEELKQFCPDKGEELIALYDRIIGMEQQIMGLYKYRMLPKNRMFGRVIWNGFMHADGTGAAFHNGTMKEVGNPDRIPGSAWGIAHEFGHVNQVRPAMKWVSTGEVTNNIYSAYVNYMLNPSSMRLEHERINGGDGNMIGGRFNAYLNNGILKGENWLVQSGPDKRSGGDNRPMVHDHFVKLAPLWQLELYFKVAGKGNPDFYPDIFYKAIKMDTRGKKDGELQLAFMKNACDAARQDLTDFFRKTGMLKPLDQELDDYTCARMTITEADCKNLIAYARKYKKPESPVIYYISVNSAEAYKNRLPVRGVYNQGVTEQGNRRIISHEVWKNAVVFETYKDREMVRITMAGTDSRDNSSTTVPYPEGSTRIEAVSWDGRRTLVYGKRPDK